MLPRVVIALVSLWLPLGGADAASPEAPPGAASCSGCHPATPSVETPVPKLVGRNPAELMQAMRAFRSSQAPTTIMDRIAKGFTDEEIAAIAAWYGAQKD